MEQKEFSIKMAEKLKKIEVDISTNDTEKLYQYMNLLLEWNQKINLTAITDSNVIILKHFIDSITINKYLKNVTRIMDIGTGAGFPGIPLKIIHPEVQFTLVDSLNKRISFLEEVCDKLELEQIECLHTRAEELAKKYQYRDKYDIVTSRAVARLATLLEYMLPFVKIGGVCICMKGANIQNELKEATKAIQVLGGELEKVEKFTLPDTDMERNIVIIKKVRVTPNMYPRKAGVPSKQPII